MNEHDIVNANNLEITDKTKKIASSCQYLNYSNILKISKEFDEAKGSKKMNDTLCSVIEKVTAMRLDEQKQKSMTLCFKQEKYYCEI